MEIKSPTLFLEINNYNSIFSVGDEDEDKNFKLIYKQIVSLQGIKNCKFIDFELTLNDLKKNIYIIEQKLNFTFKEITLIINNFNCSFANLAGFKKLNGSQILKENITYILNSLKSNIDETERKKTILHIFNSEYSLDKKKIENLPIGLFGDFYSHELSFCLINNNDYKNLHNLFNECNLKIRKIFLKSFIEGIYTSNTNPNLNAFFQIQINDKNSHIFYFENDSLKFEQNFNFGTELIAKDISKVTSLKIETVRKIIENIKLNKDHLEDELIEKKLIDNEIYKKIRKKLLYEIARARIEELLEIIIINNINLVSYNKKVKKVFLNISDNSHMDCFSDLYSYFFSKNNFNLKFSNRVTTEDLIHNVNRLVHYGWKKEAIPITQLKKSILARFFDVIFD
jgi:cell division protein FtsA